MDSLSVNAGPNITDWLTGIGTVAVATIAILFYFLDRLRAKGERPILDLFINFRPPFCHYTSVATVERAGRIHNFEAYWFRLTVANRGKTSAKDLEVIIHNVEQRVDGAWKRLSDFLPSNLKWTHTSQHYLPMLLPYTEKNIELAHIINPDANNRGRVPGEYNHAHLKLSAAQTSVFFELTILPVSSYNIVGPGEYRFMITVGGSNCSPISSTFNLKLTGEWHTEENTMLTKGVEINRVRHAS